MWINFRPLGIKGFANQLITRVYEMKGSETNDGKAVMGINKTIERKIRAYIKANRIFIELENEQDGMRNIIMIRSTIVPLPIG